MMHCKYMSRKTIAFWAMAESRRAKMASSSSIPPFGLFVKCIPTGYLHRLTFRSSKVALIVILGILSASSLGCEVYNTESLSPDCSHAKDKIVKLDSVVTLNCSINNGGTTLGKTWEQVSNILKTKDGLVLKTVNSSTRIYLTRPLEATYRSPSPRTLYPNQARKLKCRFKGWPIPRVVWLKDGKTVINGTNGFYHTEKLSEDYQNTLETSLHIPSREENEGYYTCTANSNICGRSSEKSRKMQVLYLCPTEKIDAVSKKIEAVIFSNSTFSCLAVDYFDECHLEWLFNESQLSSNSRDKYKIESAQISKCKKAFNLTVINVTFIDEGNYICRQLCKSETFKASIKLNVYPPEDTPVTVVSRDTPVTVVSRVSSTTKTPENISVQAQFVSMPGGSSRSGKKWIFPVISVLACGVFALIIAVFVRYVKKKMVFKKIERCAEDGVPINKLFISYSSKDYSWVTENLIALLDKHSIPYSIHTRDFELGKPIVQNMADNVYNSRQVLIALSDNYLGSNFCREELHMAIQRGVDTGDASLILVVIDKFVKKRLPYALRNKDLLDFEKHKRKQNWEEKLLRAVIGAKAVSSE